MPSHFKPLTSYAPDLNQGIDTGDLNGLPASVDDGSPASNSGSSGLFAVGDVGSGSAGSLPLVQGGSLTAPAPTLVTVSGSALQINITWDASVASAPSGFMNGVIAAAQAYETDFNNAVTINIDVGYGEIAGNAMATGALGESESYLQLVSYSSLLSALAAHNTDSTTASVLASLPSTQPVNGNIWVTTAQAKALGLTAATGTSLDGYIGLSSTNTFTYNTSGGVAAGTYDFNGVISHELAEVMGRLMLTGNTVGTYTNSYDLLDLLHYSGSGVRDFSASTAGYFSINGGATDGGDFNTVSGGDAADWASSMGANAFDAFSNAGVINPVTHGDLVELDALGWTVNGSLPPSPPPSGVAIAPIKTTLAAAQGTSGLTAKTSLASLTAIGGTAGDPVTLALGGTGAGAFALTSGTNGTGTLSAGTSGVAGAVNGKAYALTVTATDTTTGLSSTPTTFDVVVGASGNDIVSVATLVGSTALATPTFIYGLAGNDTLNGSGMTGKLWFDGGAGADSMTGGSGANTYLYGAASDSTVSAMDIITNFAVTKDVIDLTGIGSTALNFVGAMSGTKLAAHSIGFQTSGGNTFVYVNTSGGSESLTAVNMKIELNGSLTLGASNILHS